MTYNEFKEQYYHIRKLIKHSYSSSSVDFSKDIRNVEKEWDRLRDLKHEMLMYGHTHENSNPFRTIEEQIERTYNLMYMHSIWRSQLDYYLQSLLDEQVNLFSRFKYNHDIHAYFTYPEVYRHYSYECYMHWHGTSCGLLPIASSTNVYGIVMSRNFSPEVASTHIPLFVENMVRFEPEQDGIVLVFPVTDHNYQLVYFDDEFYGIQNIQTSEILVKDSDLLGVLKILHKKVNE